VGSFSVILLPPGSDLCPKHSKALQYWLEEQKVQKIMKLLSDHGISGRNGCLSSRMEQPDRSGSLKQRAHSGAQENRMNVDRMRIALRVLHTLKELQPASELDLVLLRSWVPQAEHNGSAAELARLVIQEQLPPPLRIEKQLPRVLKMRA